MAIKPSAVLRFRQSTWGILSICAGLAWSVPVQALEPIEAYGSRFAQQTPAPAKQARVYAFRSPGSISHPPVNLYLNGRYLASLLKGGYTEFCLAPGKLQLQAAHHDAGQMHMGKLQAGLSLEPQAGKLLYLKVQEGAGYTARVEAVSESLALEELRQTRQQIHTISRAPQVQECEAALAEPPKVSSPPKPAPQREYALQADALFEFGKAVLKAEGFNAIEVMIQQVQQEYSSIDKIRVIGYTDPIGPVALNKKLSAQRANTVADRLHARGLRPKSGFEAEGRWSLELAKAGCKDTPTPENKICHAPNRRVVIVIFGARR